MIKQCEQLPPGQYEIDEFPRFGLTKFAHRFPSNTRDISIEIGGDVARRISLSSELQQLERVSQTSDFHCVTTWSKRDLHWSGFRFRDLYEQLVQPQADCHPDATLVVFQGQDGYRTGLPLDDLMSPDVLLADTLDDAPLPLANGAPLRLVAPAHYGYKSAKHVSSIHFLNKHKDYRPAAYRFMDHPRARVEFEERGSLFPGWMLRFLYRSQVTSTRRKFRDALAQHEVSPGQTKASQSP